MHLPGVPMKMDGETPLAHAVVDRKVFTVSLLK